MAILRLIAPRHLAGTVIDLSDNLTLQVPASGIVEIADRTVILGRDMEQPIEGIDRPDLVLANTHIRELLHLGFQHTPAAGGVAERPAGRFDGEQWFCTFTGRPLWWSQGAWRDALGRVA